MMTGNADVEYRRRAWLFAHKLITLARTVDDDHDCDLLVIPTKEIAKAMGEDGPAKLEDVQAFIFHVLEFMKGFDMVSACGCGYLSMRIAPKRVWEDAQSRMDDLTEFVCDDVDAYFDVALEKTRLLW